MTPPCVVPTFRPYTVENLEFGGFYASSCESRVNPVGRVGDHKVRRDATEHARNVEIRSRNNRSADQTIGCSTVDEFVRLTLDLRGRQHRAWATPLPNAQEQCGAMDAVYG